ncbi:ETS variant transcription factor anterior open [Leptinotarsa decemlineata]|uniref:ETS variant transcription factor anterior open n=1 Tax=Leptinotarsa decemlineata TaxID=7539 RepID=UPI000C255301|nr:ets DNA-binding protein pokkuri [Leptinotarsa decemlineata]XP_023030005.1 ets DNA-binding protein pokkuri [Leptinotarsa decemlineata]
MKLIPGHLPPIATSTNMDRIPLPLSFNADLLWRYPLGFPPLSHQNPPSSPLWDYKSQLPASLPSDPRLWNREDVITFLQWSEREFDIQPIDHEMFQMNGKAMCFLTRNDLSERAPGSGDVLHNVLQILVREANNLQRMLPNSPVTPTSRHPYPLSPHSHPPTPNWNILSQNNESSPSSHAASLAAQLMAQSNSVILSPAPSIDSQTSSPLHADNQGFGHSIFNVNGSNGSGSNPSDSDEDNADKKGFNGSPPSTPSAYSLMPQIPYLLPRSPQESASSPISYKNSGREFFPSDCPEPNTNGRLLWDFLQQLLNDPAQRYTSYISWKNRETGVFKIVDPSGLAKLWGIQKNHLSMNYDKMSRALRYYYRVNILRKVQGERHCYQFLRNPTELKNIKNISLLRQQMSPTSTKPPIATNISQSIVKSEPAEMSDEITSSRSSTEYDEKPTDLSIDGPTDLSNNTRHINIVCSPDPPITGPHH